MSYFDDDAKMLSLYALKQFIILPSIHVSQRFRLGSNLRQYKQSSLTFHSLSNYCFIDIILFSFYFNLYFHLFFYLFSVSCYILNSQSNGLFLVHESKLQGVILFLNAIMDMDSANCFSSIIMIVFCKYSFSLSTFSLSMTSLSGSSQLMIRFLRLCKLYIAPLLALLYSVITFLNSSSIDIFDRGSGGEF